MTGGNILIVEDEPAISDNVEIALQMEGFNSTTCRLASEALAELKRQRFQLIILDVGLPDMNGFELCKEIRKDSEIPILFLTARSDEIDRILGLEMGADDYVTKPFSPRELAIRVKVILKRSAPAITAPEHRLCCGDFVLEREKANISFHQQPLTLTRSEYQILATMIEQPNRVFSRDQLLDLLSGEGPAVSLDRAVDTHIKTLRGKLRQIDSDCAALKTHRGLGYSLQDHS